MDIRKHDVTHLCGISKFLCNYFERCDIENHTRSQEKIIIFISRIPAEQKLGIEVEFGKVYKQMRTKSNKEQIYCTYVSLNVILSSKNRFLNKTAHMYFWKRTFISCRTEYKKDFSESLNMIKETSSN